MPTRQTRGDSPTARGRRAHQRGRARLSNQCLEPASTPRQLPPACLLERDYERDRARQLALACLPSKDQLNSAYSELCQRIDQIVKQAEQEGSLRVAIAGLNSIRQTLDSLTRLAGYDRRIDTQVNV